MLLFCPNKNLATVFKVQTEYHGFVGLFELLVILAQEKHVPNSCMKQQTPQNRNQGLSLSFCKCFFSKLWFQVQLSHSFQEWVKFRKTRWHSRFAWNSCSACHHQHGNCIELDDTPPTPPLFTSASTGITSGSLHFHWKKLNFHQGKLDGINCCHPESIHCKHLFHVVCAETM